MLGLFHESSVTVFILMLVLDWTLFWFCGVYLETCITEFTIFTIFEGMVWKH